MLFLLSMKIPRNIIQENLIVNIGILLFMKWLYMTYLQMFFMLKKNLDLIKLIIFVIVKED